MQIIVIECDDQVPISPLQLNQDAVVSQGEYQITGQVRKVIQANIEGIEGTFRIRGLS